MNFLFELSHPKHYYQFKEVINRLKSLGHTVRVIARDKDVLLKILADEGVDYTIYGRHGKSILAKFTAVPNLMLSYSKIVMRFRPDWIVSKASPYAALVRYVHKAKTCITPDSEVVNLTNRFVAPNSDKIITPRSFTIHFGQKHHFINGFFEDCYLHPSLFRPDEEVFNQLTIKKGEVYFILRFIAWNANHDLNRYGFSDQEKISLIDLLSRYGKVFISSEGALPTSLEAYRIKIPASAMHSALHYASLYIGDSQTMATEAALLGTPSVRYNSFVGPNDMSNFIVMENQFGLLKNCASYKEVQDYVSSLLTQANPKQEWLDKREVYYKNVGDINQQILTHLLHPETSAEPF
ncbi:DUF354 domain-containing protein [Rhabdobacter roseus]|uniref:DUF354 domain-containing protein n=1 Tax=Rhabdobacter roseus TaxID=1655419 RepID=A0A840TT96_9BACT|nr:DUF354 domain-containing protein [Rhabdobacter roseus]MBB5283248.1 hypothetical protein [Rhabdobacter roseus]